MDKDATVICVKNNHTTHTFNAVIKRGFFSRMLGLIGKREEQRLCVFPQCSSIHTFGMQRTIDVLFLSPKGSVMKQVRALKPKKVCRCFGAATTIERLHSPAPWPDNAYQIFIKEK